MLFLCNLNLTFRLRLQIYPKYYISFKNLWTEALIRKKRCWKAKLFTPSRVTEDGLAGLEFSGFFFRGCLTDITSRAPIFLELPLKITYNIIVVIQRVSLLE